jgi:hypothetical protein
MRRKFFRGLKNALDLQFERLVEFQARMMEKSRARKIMKFHD